MQLFMEDLAADAFVDPAVPVKTLSELDRAAAYDTPRRRKFSELDPTLTATVLVNPGELENSDPEAEAFEDLVPPVAPLETAGSRGQPAPLEAPVSLSV